MSGDAVVIPDEFFPGRGFLTARAEGRRDDGECEHQQSGRCDPLAPTAEAWFLRNAWMRSKGPKHQCPYQPSVPEKNAARNEHQKRKSRNGAVRTRRSCVEDVSTVELARR